MAQWIRYLTLTHAVSNSNPLAMAVVSLGKPFYPHCLVPQTGLHFITPLVAHSQAHLLSLWPGKL